MFTLRPRSASSTLTNAHQTKAIPRTIAVNMMRAPRYDGGVYGSGELMREVCAVRSRAVKMTSPSRAGPATTVLQVVANY